MNLPAAVLHGVALDAVLAIFRSVHVDIRFNLFQKSDRIRFVEDMNVIDHPQRQQHLRPLTLGNDRSSFTFVRSH